jgi:hypothetical protein
MGWEHQQELFYARVLQVSKNWPPKAAIMTIGAAENLVNLAICKIVA